MKAASVEYVRPDSLAEAVRILASAGGRDVQVLAGGQSLLAMMNLRAAAPDVLVDISRLDDLRVASHDGDAVRIGACVTHAAIEDGLTPDPSGGLMPVVASRLAYRSVRTRGTIGGSLALSDPAADWGSVMPALDAQITLVGPNGRREVSATGFATGIYDTVRQRDEVLESILIPKLSVLARWGFSKFCRKSGEFAESIAVVVLDPPRNYARVVLGAIDGPPIILSRASDCLRAEGNPEAVERAATADLDERAGTFDDYHRSVHHAMISRAVAQVLESGVLESGVLQSGGHESGVPV
jgi:aerobic carbon-monoxide dehydrogenase medium subunit